MPDKALTVKPKILVVDDTPANLTAMKVLLKSVAADLVMASSGNEALGLALKHKFALVLLDVNMPEMDGFEVAELLSEDESTKYLPIIFVTALNSDEATILKGYASGAVDYVQKPIIPTILLAKVRIFLDLWQLRAGLENEILARRTAEMEVRYFAQHDALTNLPNRRQFQSELERIIEQAKRKVERFAVLFLDLDGFKRINDEMGHEVGDAVLIEMGARLQKKMRKTDIVSRFGGDEFIIVLTDVKDPLSLKKILEQFIKISAEPHSWEDKVIQHSVSIGVAIYPEHGQSYQQLLSNADSAMYLAKERGKNNFQFFSETLNQRMKRNSLIETQLHQALENNEFEVYYQPIISLEEQKLIGAEALLRWENSTLGQISPEEFIPIAETSGLICKIGVWVLEQVISLMVEKPDLHFAINASSLQFNNSILKDTIEKHITEHKLDPSKLEVEITEGVLIDRHGKAGLQLQAIHDLGVSLSVDDFGTGYSSLSYLKNCPVSTVKIDRSFVAGFPADAGDVTLIKAIIAMAKGLNLFVIAEGVENRAQSEFLNSLGCGQAQGYFFAKPMKKNEFCQYGL